MARQRNKSREHDFFVIGRRNIFDILEAEIPEDTTVNGSNEDEKKEVHEFRNLYEPLEIEEIEEDMWSYDEETGEYEDFTSHFIPFDIRAIEAQGPIFTRDTLCRIGSNYRRVLAELTRPMQQRNLAELRDSGGESETVWRRRWSDGEEADEEDFVDNAVGVYYLTRVEMNRSFQEHYAMSHGRAKEVQELNADRQSEGELHLLPRYWIASYSRTNDKTHEDTEKMGEMREKLQRAQHIWQGSESCKQLMKLVIKNASGVSTPIQNIVCVGLGSLRSGQDWYAPVQQHLAVFSLADALDAHNHAKDPGTASVRVHLIDPCYEQQDRVLLHEMAELRSMSFVRTNPEALLLIGANTLVVTAYLPFGMPLMQIIADMCDGNDTGPALILCDQMKGLDETRHRWAYTERGSPRVAKMLKSYKKEADTFQDLDHEVKEVLNAVGKSYWLKNMDLHAKISHQAP